MTFGEYFDKIREEGRKEMLLDQLREKFTTVPSGAEARVVAAEVAEIRRWALRVLTADSVDEVFAGSPG